MSKVPTRSPTHSDIDMSRLSSMGLEVEDLAGDGPVQLSALIELSEDRGRPVSHYLAAVATATELRVADDAKVSVRVCAGNCQQYGALDILDHLAARWEKTPRAFAIAPVSCLDRCDLSPACELHGPHGVLVVAPATRDALDTALDELTAS